jgi:hypothetical protein
MRSPSKLSLLCLAALWAAAAAPGRAPAATVTVSTVAQLRTAVQNAQSGDIIELTDGTYAWSDASSLVVIQDKTNLTVRSQSGNRDAVVLKGQGMNSGTEFCFKLYRSPNCTIENMTLRDVYWHCVQVNDGSHYCTLRNLVMIDAGEGPVKVTSAGLSGYSDYGLIEGCRIAYSSVGVRQVVEGVDIIAAVGWVIRDCQFYRASKGGGPDQIGWGIFAKGNSQDTVIERCYFEDCDIAISFGGGGTDPAYFRDGITTYEHRGGIMRNNVVNRTKDVAVYMNSATGFKLYNNTLWSTFPYADSSVDVRFNSSGDVCNNIASQYYRLRDGGQATVSTNLWRAESDLLSDPVTGDFHLRYTAADAIDQGIDTSADVPDDMDGETRPGGAGVDIGADEHVVTGPFPDVPDRHWAATEINACSAAGIVYGFDDGTYRPDVLVRRDQMAVYVARALAGGDQHVPSGPPQPTFPDVPDTGYGPSGTDPFWAYDYIEYCYQEEVVQGYDDDLYHPERNVNRAQMAVYISRALVGGDQYVPTGPVEAHFPDVPNTGYGPDGTEPFWAYDYIEYCYQEGVVQGYDDDLYHPERIVTRAQMAVYVARAFGLA